ncbi:hypothetical protein [Sphingopyxis sp.]|jgi:hypothetical protein|nr:hypothetical protein [Sphingopyxis sp.]
MADDSAASCVGLFLLLWIVMARRGRSEAVMRAALRQFHRHREAK